MQGIVLQHFLSTNDLARDLLSYCRIILAMRHSVLSPVADAARSAPSAARTGTKSSDSGPSADLFAAMVDSGARIDDAPQPASGNQASVQRTAGDASPATQGNAKAAIVTGDAAVAVAILPQLQAVQNPDVAANLTPQTLPIDPTLAKPGAEEKTNPGSGNTDGDAAPSADAEPALVPLPSVPADPAVAAPFGGMALATAVIAPQQPTDTAPATGQLVVGAVTATGTNSAPQVEAPSLQTGMTAGATASPQPQVDSADLPASATPRQSPVTPNSDQGADMVARAVSGEADAAAGVQTPSPANSGIVAQPDKPVIGAHQIAQSETAAETPAATDPGLRAQTGEAKADATAPSHAATSNLATSAHEKTHAAIRNEAAVDTAPAASAAAQPASVNMANWTHLTAAPATAPVTASVMIDATGSVPLTGLAVEIASRAVAGNTRFEIRLDPPELGRIDVRLDVDSKGQVTSHLTVERTDTLDLLRRDAPQLQRALQDAGLKTGDSALQFSLRDQSSGSGANADDGSRRRADQILIQSDEVIPAEITSRGYGRLVGSAGGLDIRV
jgi:chemotaxis protein MotD